MLVPAAGPWRTIPTGTEKPRGWKSEAKKGGKVSARVKERYERRHLFRLFRFLLSLKRLSVYSSACLDIKVRAEKEFR